MSLWRSLRPDEPPAPKSSSEPGSPPESIAGDRGIPDVHRASSLQSRLSSAFAIALMLALGLGLLTWYYARALTRPAQAHQAAQAAVKNRAQGEMTLPALGPIASPLAPKAEAGPPTAPSESPTIERVLGPAPPLPAGSTVAMPVGVLGAGN